MINETIILLTPFEDCSSHRLAKHVRYVKSMRAIPFDVCFYQPLLKIFSKVILYDYVKQMLEVGVDRTNNKVVELVRRERPKYVLWLAFGDYYEILESTFDTIRQEGTRVIGWFFDDEVRFDYYSKWWGPHLDYFVTNDPEAVPKYSELGARAMFAITDTWSAVERDWSRVNEKYEVTFVGSIRADREEYLQALEDAKIPVHLFGLSWKNFVSYQEMVGIFGTSKINLNFSKTYRYMKLGIKGRIFKVCLSGGFMLTEYAPGIEKYFEINKEVVCFHNKEEMIEKITHFLNHDEERRAIARAGWERAINKYSASQIMSNVFQKIEQYTASSDNNNRRKDLIMPLPIKKRVSNFYKSWGVAYLLENDNGLWKDALALSLSYNPSNTVARAWNALGSLPFIFRFLPINLFIIAIKLRNLLFAWGGHLPYAKKIYHALKTRTSPEDA
jgi:spore maturation protein CgeB